MVGPKRGLGSRFFRRHSYYKGGGGTRNFRCCCKRFASTPRTFLSQPSGCWAKKDAGKSVKTTTPPTALPVTVSSSCIFQAAGCLVVISMNAMRHGLLPLLTQA